MDKEVIKERVKFYTELLKLLWVLLIALGGGLSGLFLRGVNEGKDILITMVGVILFIMAVIGVVKIIKDIHRLLKKLEDV